MELAQDCVQWAGLGVSSVNLRIPLQVSVQSISDLVGVVARFWTSHSPYREANVALYASDVPLPPTSRTFPAHHSWLCSCFSLR
jgi:hypothetical protein